MTQVGTMATTTFSHEKLRRNEILKHLKDCRLEVAQLQNAYSKLSDAKDITDLEALDEAYSKLSQARLRHDRLQEYANDIKQLIQDEEREATIAGKGRSLVEKQQALFEVRQQVGLLLVLQKI